MKWLPLLVLAAGVAHADTPTQCIDGMPELVAHGELAPRVKFAGPKTQLCLGTTCKRVGRLLAQDLTPLYDELTLRPTPKAVAVSADLRFALVDQTAYDVILDREVRPRPPASVTRQRPTRLELVGNALVATWGPTASLVGLGGAPLGEPFAAGMILAVGARIAVVNREAGDVTILDATGRRLGKLSLAPSLELAMATSADDSLSVTWRTGDTWRIARISFSAEGVPGLESMQPLSCR